MSRDFSLLRSWLFVPGDSARKLERCRNFGADAIIIDLEDAVLPENKIAARALATDAIAAKPRGKAAMAIRVNALDTGLAFDDLAQTVRCEPDAYVLPKATQPEDIVQVSRRIGELEAANGIARGTIGLVPIVTESPRAFMNLDANCRADPRVVAVIWGTEDLSAAMGARRVKDDEGRMLDVFKVVRAMAVLAGSAAGIAVIDTPVVEIDAADVLRRESLEAAQMGFTGKLAIHPSQVAPINEAFLPSHDELIYARALLEAQTQVSDGAFRFRGKMIDMPHIRIARRMAAMADTHKVGAKHS